RDRAALFDAEARASEDEGQVICLDRSREAEFDAGWYEPNILPPVARWMSRAGRVRFRAQSVSSIGLDLTSHIPDLSERPLGLELFLNGERLCALSLFRQGWLELKINVPEILRRGDGGGFEFEICADRTWQPRPDAAENPDDRELSVAVCNLEIFP
ncbi:MAG TPA: hypothetical protein VFS10_23300, partial [Pyrinomonadaceae bacterium]|nr:hypothetical protein [Pyrinomonadaceae bacterium]